MTTISEADQSEWGNIFYQSGYKLATLAKMAKVDEGSFRKYLNCDRIPRETNRRKMVTAMIFAKQTPRLKFHPSYGYATEAQIKQLQTMGAGPQMEYLLKQIEEQTRNKGKFK